MKYFIKLIVFYFLIDLSFAEFEKDLQLKLILAEPGDTIKLDAGFFPILGTLSMEGKQNIVIKGSGTSSTILNFSNQVEGAQGLSISNCNNIILEDFIVNQRARAWLDINCAHCHGRGRTAESSGLFLEYEEKNQTAIGIFKTPVAAGRGSGGRKYNIVPGYPEKSIIEFRINSVDLGIMMPESS